MARSTGTPLTEDRKKEIFLALVQSQDEGANVAGSRKEVAKRFGVSEDNVREIEREGLDQGWPPL